MSAIWDICRRGHARERRRPSPAAPPPERWAWIKMVDNAALSQVARGRQCTQQASERADFRLVQQPWGGAWVIDGKSTSALAGRRGHQRGGAPFGSPVADGSAVLASRCVLCRHPPVGGRRYQSHAREGPI